MSADASSLAGALAVAFAHGPLAGIAPAVVSTREGRPSRGASAGPSTGRLGLARGRAGTLDACHEKIAGHILRLWPELEEAAEWL